MKRNVLLVILFFIISVTGRTQMDSMLKKQIFHGAVMNEKYKPIYNASVIVEGDEKETAAVTDSLGYFKIMASPGAVLVINADGYDPLLVVTHTDELVRAVMIKSKTINDRSEETIRRQSAQNDFQNYANAENSRNYTGSFLPVFTTKENTVGSRYLFDKWVSGKVFNKEGSIIGNNSYLFNYDKIGKKFLTTQDKQLVIELNTDAIESFSLLNDDTTTVFEKVPLISKDFLIAVVKNEKKYSLYKSITTTFHRADYTTNGIFESGNNYDSFVDKSEYYIVFPGGKTFKKLELKRKFIKETLAADEQKVKKYFSKDEEGVINENFLKGLIVFLNQ